ncbi:hypothetical protein [Pseudolactococcus reticulitermitis]|uniref:Uncharacterized protein n=1 Tax=Pseudolactococcus reticulitermitis TaxID=2025039 RepID=A0A224WVU5_9LACT|nr:hypothetical protein [Lactococcus reticulitermitis]GAX46509.1 hypothetical protein RsY01_88 [Lactococcus reticulitermitis]
MNKILKGLMVFLIIFLCRSNFVCADDTSATTSGDMQTSEQVLAITPLAISGGTGRESDPFLVATIADLKSALSQSIPPGESALYIKLTADIIYAYSDRTISINKNTVLDGDGHYILYSGTNYDYDHFITGADNLAITFKNIKYGNATYPNSNWYGILHVTHTNTNFVVENIDYDIQKGGQPFYANTNVNTLTFKGKNNFKAGTSSGGYDGEFAQGFTSINFAEDSQTTIYHDAYNESAFLYAGTSQTITVGKNALVDITTNKQYLSWDGNLTLKVLEKGQFKFKAISGINKPTLDIAFKALGTITMEFAKDAIGRFTTEKAGFSGESPTINATSPNYILFDSPSGKAALNGATLKFSRKDADGYAYPIKYFKGGLKEITPNVTGNKSVTASDIGNGESVVYARAPKITGLSADPMVGTDLSQIRVQITQWTPESLVNISKVSYKLATKRLYSGNDITVAVAQTSITNATPSQGVFSIREVWATNNIATDSIYEFQDLSPKTYYLYTKLEVACIPGYNPLSSLWIEQIVEVPSYIEVTLPDTLEFLTPKAGEIVKDHHLANYTAINHGNVPVNLDLKALSVNPGSSSAVSLVDDCQGKKQVHLKLVAEHPSGSDNSIWERLLPGPITGQTNTLQPYWSSGDHEADLYLRGEHSISVLDGGPYQVNYNLTIAVSQAL